MTGTTVASAPELTQERIDWLNEYWTKEDFKSVGMKPKRGKTWYETRRWQVYNLCKYALGETPPYGPSKDERFVL